MTSRRRCQPRKLWSLIDNPTRFSCTQYGVPLDHRRWPWNWYIVNWFVMVFDGGRNSNLYWLGVVYFSWFLFVNSVLVLEPLSGLKPPFLTHSYWWFVLWSTFFLRVRYSLQSTIFIHSACNWPGHLKICISVRCHILVGSPMEMCQNSWKTWGWEKCLLPKRGWIIILKAIEKSKYH